MQVRRTYQTPKPKPSALRVSIASVWSGEQNHELNFLFQKLQEANRHLMSQVQDIPGFVDLTPRQQSRLYSELAGQGMMPNLLHLMRKGKLDIDLMRNIVHNPKKLSELTDKIKAFSDVGIINQ
jgi:hypothetical protein